PDNTAVDLGAYTCKKPAGDTTACQGITDYSTFVYHPGIHKLLMFGGGHATTFRDDVDVFDFSSLTWGHGDVSTPCTDMTKENQTAYGTWATTGHPHSRHTYDLLVVAQNTGELILLRQSGLAGGCSPADYNTWRNAGTIHHYNPESKTWTPAVGTTA